MSFIDNIKIWNSGNEFFYKNGTEYRQFKRDISLKDIQENLKKVKYYDLYKIYKEELYKLRPEIQNNNYVVTVLDNVRFMPFVPAFYTWIYSCLDVGIEKFIPNLDEFINYYKTAYCEEVNGLLRFKDGYSETSKDFLFSEIDLKCRIGYPFGSFIVEFYLHKGLQEYFSSLNIPVEVIYDLYNDYIDGIDILLKYNKKIVGVCSYRNSKRGNISKQLKDMYRRDTDSNNTVYLHSYLGHISPDETDKVKRVSSTLDFKNEKDCFGTVHVPTKNQIKQLGNKILKEMEIEI